jgi:glycosyltransferase involved in cell wall biosynthesis
VTVPALVVVTGRFLRARPTGLHRVARSLLRAALEAGLAAEVVAPEGVEDPLVTTTVPSPAGTGKGGDHLWEQVVLPRYAGSRLVLSLANTAPVAARRAAVVVHDLGPLVGPQWFAPSMQAYGRLVLAAARRADLVVAPSQQVVDELAAAGVERSRLGVVRNGLDPGFGPASDVEVARARDDLDLRRPFVLVVGWADPRKDTRTAALAHLLATEVTPHDLVLAGLAHPNFPPVDVPEGPSIRRVGYVDDDRLRALLTGAAALAYPSRYEGFGLPPLEAWACGTPALVADVPAVREATEGRARYVGVGDVTGLAGAMVEAVRGELAVPALPAWTWADAAGQLLERLQGLTG